MATQIQKRKKSRAKKPIRKTPTLRTQVDELQREVADLRAENRQLKKSLGALMFKDEPRNMDLTPEDGVFEPPLAELIAQIKRAG